MMMRNYYFGWEAYQYWNGHHVDQDIISWHHVCLLVKALQNQSFPLDRSILRNIFFDAFRYMDKVVLFGVLLNPDGLGIITKNNYSFLW